MHTPEQQSPPAAHVPRSGTHVAVGVGVLVGVLVLVGVAVCARHRLPLHAPEQHWPSSVHAPVSGTQVGVGVGVFVGVSVGVLVGVGVCVGVLVTPLVFVYVGVGVAVGGKMSNAGCPLIQYLAVPWSFAFCTPDHGCPESHHFMSPKFAVAPAYTRPALSAIATAMSAQRRTISSQSGHRRPQSALSCTCPAPESRTRTHRRCLPSQRSEPCL